jgi:hypothetical protein
MKTYKDYLFESEKKYGFRVKFATDVDSDHMEALKRTLAKWNMEAISEPKTLPIAEVQPGFAHLRNTPISIVDIVVNYPCTPAEVQAAVHEATEIPLSHILVLTPQQEVLAAPIVPNEQPVLTSEYPASKAPQLLADLANALKEKTIDHPFAAPKTKAAKTSNDLPQGNTSPVGTKKNKLPPLMARRSK